MYIYKLTIVVNNEEFFYIGKCETGNEDYCGSGKILQRYYDKYGMSIIKSKDTLYTTSNRVDLIEAEKKFILENNAVTDKRYLNLTSGGEGGNTFITKTEEEIRSIMQKRSQTMAMNPHLIMRRIQKWRDTMAMPHVREKTTCSIRRSQPKRIENYKKTRSGFSEAKKQEISENISRAVKESKLRETELEKRDRKQKELLTKSQRSLDQRMNESQLKSRSAKLVAANRTAEEWVEYGQKVSVGVKRYKSSLSKEEKEKTVMLYRETMYRKNGMYDYMDIIRDMLETKSSIEIFHFLKSKGIKTHHICVKGFIDFIRSYTKLSI